MATDYHSKVFYKITNKEENHNGYQYQDGLNVFNIFKFVHYGRNVRKITLP
jgi:hypothetical protein